MFLAPSRGAGETNMAHAARVLWPSGRALAWRLGGRPSLRLPEQSRAGFTAAAGGPGPTATTRKGGPRLLGAAALALGGALGLYHTVRWHLRAQDLRAERTAAQVSPGQTEPWVGALGSAPNFGTSGNRRGQESSPLSILDLERVTWF